MGFSVKNLLVGAETQSGCGRWYGEMFCEGGGRVGVFVCRDKCKYNWK